MNLPAEILPAWLAIPALGLFVFLAGWQSAGAPWRLLGANRLQGQFAVAVLALALLWSLDAGVHAGLGLHLLGLTSMVLVFGWRLALVGGALALILLAAIGSREWGALGVNGLLGVAFPVALAVRLHALIYRRLPRHLFIYLFVTAHFSSMAVLAAVVLAGGVLTVLLGAHSWERLFAEHLVFLPLILLPEGFLNGALLTGLTVYRPEWVRSFNDCDYIEGK